MKYTSHFPLGIVIPLLACSVPLQASIVRSCSLP
ncbi:hypothetical protein, partial [Klebsiella pneumoniae]